MEPIRELRKICQSGKHRSLYMAMFIRKFSIYFTWFLLHMPISANQISLLMILMGIIGGVFLALGGYVNGLTGMLFLQFFLVFDCVDGEVARYKNQSSLKGKYLDLIANDITHVSMFLGLTIGMLDSNYKVFNILLSHNHVILVFGLSAMIFPLLSKVAFYYAKEVRDDFVVLWKGAEKNVIARAVGFSIFPVNLIVIMTTCAIFNLLHFALISYGVIFPLCWIILLIMRFKKL